MDKEFHYDVNYLIARMGGFSAVQAKRIAAAAQFVDDNTERITVHSGSFEPMYESIVTQTYDLTLADETLRNTYCAFHFVPSFEAPNIWRTSKHNAIAVSMMSDALSSEQEELIGIASHAYADTYAHDGFSGTKCADNALFGKGILPCYGHMFFAELPDQIGKKWLDTRVMRSVDNNNKFIECALSLFRSYAEYNKLKPLQYSHFEAVIRTDFPKIFGNGYYSLPSFAKRLARMKKYNAMAKDHFGEKIPHYKAEAYLKSAVYFNAKHKQYFANLNFEDSAWLKFQESAKSFQEICLSKIKECERGLKN